MHLFFVAATLVTGGMSFSRRSPKMRSLAPQAMTTIASPRSVQVVDFGRSQSGQQGRNREVDRPV